MYSLRTSFWIVPDSRGGLDALLLGDQLVEEHEQRRRRVDRHRGRHGVERDVAQQRAHVGDRVDGDARAADLAAGERVVGVEPELRGQVEGDREPGLARGRAAGGSGCSSPRPTRSRRTGASSTAARGSRPGARPGCTGTSPGRAAPPGASSRRYTGFTGMPDSVECSRSADTSGRIEEPRLPEPPSSTRQPVSAVPRAVPSLRGSGSTIEARPPRFNPGGRESGRG